jgi:hypothetical protein
MPPSPSLWVYAARMTLMERVRKLVPGRRRRDDRTAELAFGTLERELVADENGVLQDRLADPESVAPACPECGRPAVDDTTTAEDGSVWHTKCKLHAMLGHLGDSPDATHCAVCGEPLAAV